jgi:hypothetical protein
VARPRVTDTPALWAGLLAGPAAWALHLQGGFALSAWATERGNAGPLHALGALCLLAAVGGGLLARRAWLAVGGLPSGTEGPDTARVRYLSVVGMMASVLFSCVIVAQWVAVVMLPRTWGAG